MKMKLCEFLFFYTTNAFSVVRQCSKAQRNQSLIFNFKRYFLWKCETICHRSSNAKFHLSTLTPIMINLELYRSIVYSHITCACLLLQQSPIHLGLSLRFIGIFSRKASRSQYMYISSFDNRNRTFGNRACYHFM